jgi:ABC-type Fe3+-hydroxamate transport system substrate-binding protein
VFDDLNLPAPQVSIESVLQRNPQMILVGIRLSAGLEGLALDGCAGAPGAG